MKETKKTIVSAKGEDLPMNGNNPKLMDVFEQEKLPIVDGITLPDDLNYIPDENNIVVQPPVPSDRTPGGIIKPAYLVQKEADDYNKLPVLVMAVGNNVKNYKPGDYVYLDRHVKDAATRFIIEGIPCVVCAFNYITGKAKHPEKIVKILKAMKERENNLDLKEAISPVVTGIPRSNN